MPLKRLSIALALAMILAACGGSDAEQAVGEAAAEQIDEEVSEEAMDDDMTEEAMDDDMTEEAMDDDMTDGHMPTTFTVTIENRSESTNLPTPLAPGAFAVHSAMDTLFAAGELDRGEGLEALAEDGDPNGLIDALTSQATVKAAAAFAVPDAASEAGPAAVPRRA